ncbi:hypothetical protein OEZ71_01140 [Defluviimonas sp. WL0050]|uniref:SoxS protein n=1 Tax=Albidovulum litorale TaxID=2984134 RepID=A0ABT2ZIL9_9RHOB|nr:hypothetical protein [Defluviimonas sp. WL0050]MCV2870895.1 hypothetical protein [Defluviimonas sp. WL0050]
MRIALIPFLAALLVASPAMADLRLLMVEQDGCAYCAEWDRVIAPIYPKTPEGQTAPLERVHLRGPYPSDVEIGPRPVFTPTFILIADGREVGRIDGYPGEDFFWGLLGQMMENTGQFERKDTE